MNSDLCPVSINMLPPWSKTDHVHLSDPCRVCTITEGSNRSRLLPQCVEIYSFASGKSDRLWRAAASGRLRTSLYRILQSLRLISATWQHPGSSTGGSVTCTLAVRKYGRCEARRSSPLSPAARRLSTVRRWFSCLFVMVGGTDNIRQI
jgi:hypothetical protein